MEHVSLTFTGATDVPEPGELEVARDRRLARAAHLDLVLIGMPRVNLLLIGVDGAVWQILETLLPDLAEPIVGWSPGEPLVLPPDGGAGTMVLHDVGYLACDEQQRLAAWLERAAGRTQMISTSDSPLLPRVEAGTFSDRLYYRLNTVCVVVS